MTAIPRSFRAFVVARDGDRVERAVREMAPDGLPAGEVEIHIEWSGINYKDGLATIPDGKVARISPLIPGIDLAGEVVGSEDPSIPVGSRVLTHGYELGVSHHGGFAEYARVPAGWVVPLPDDLSSRDAAAIGTAGFTAARSVALLEARGLTPASGRVVVTGATGGVGGTAIGILVERGYEVWAVTGKPEAHEDLRARGVAGILDRTEVTAEGKPLESERWAAAVDSVGAATLPYLLRTLAYGGAVAASGNTSGATLATTVFPFILRGCALIGVDSAHVPIAERRAFWARLAGDLRPPHLGDRLTEITLDELEPALDAILAGRARGRWVVRLGD